MLKTLATAHADDRGAINFVQLFLFAAVVAGAYYAYVYLPPAVDHYAIKNAVRTGTAQAYAQRNEGTVKRAIYNGFKERAIQNVEIARDGSVIKRPLRIDDQNMTIRFTETPPAVSVELQYERKIILPIFKKPRTLRYRFFHTEDLSEIKY